jgi:PKD repeat protein
LKRKIALGIMLILFLVGTLSMNVNETQSDLVEEWVPYVPYSPMVDLEFWMLNETSYINVTITFPDSGYMISDWGTVTKDGGEIWVDSEIWDWTGYSFQVITTVSHTYNLGPLDGYYTFTFKAWGIDVKSVSFKASTAQMLLETDKGTYFLGENVAIILKNIGNETESIGGYPAWMIYAYPEEEPVYPEIFAFLLWELAPGENDTSIWNQYNAFTNSPVYPGMYVVRDTQGWGLSAYFTIVAVNLPPTADFVYSPTFPYVGQTVTFDASDSSDPDGTIVSYEWDFGDGSTGADVLTSHTYESAGIFNVTLTVTDDLGATDTLQQEITVDPLPTLTITINKVKKGTTETILLELVDDDYDGFITQNVDKRLRGIIRRTHKTTTFDFPGTYSATKGALNVTLQSRNDFIITLS